MQSPDIRNSNPAAIFHKMRFSKNDARDARNAMQPKTHKTNGKFMFKYKRSALTCLHATGEIADFSTEIFSIKEGLRRESYKSKAASKRINSRVRGLSSSRSAYCLRSERIRSKSPRQKFRRFLSKCKISTAAARFTRKISIESASPLRIFKKSSSGESPAHFRLSQIRYESKSSKEFCGRTRPSKSTANGSDGNAQSEANRKSNRRKKTFTILLSEIS